MFNFLFQKKDEKSELDIEFIYSELDEFSDPVYEIWRKGRGMGILVVRREGWFGSLEGDRAYSAAVFEAVAEKLRELNADLEEARKSFWGWK